MRIKEGRGGEEGQTCIMIDPGSASTTFFGFGAGAGKGTGMGLGLDVGAREEVLLGGTGGGGPIMARYKGGWWTGGEGPTCGVKGGNKATGAKTSVKGR